MTKQRRKTQKNDLQFRFEENYQKWPIKYTSLYPKGHQTVYIYANIIYDISEKRWHVIKIRGTLQNPHGIKYCTISRENLNGHSSARRQEDTSITRT
jgi:hypothetical protein